MKINNEYINTKNYSENFFAEDLNGEAVKEGAFENAMELVKVSNGENHEAVEMYNKYGKHSDYELLEQSGMAADEDEEQAVTVYERIQIQLMTYCENYNYTGTTIDKSKMEQVLGSPAMAEAVAKGSNLEKFNDNTKEYMLKNNLEPTVDNVYMAMHSSANKEVADITDTSIKNAVCDKLVSEGYQLEEKTVENAMWLVSRNIEVNSENLSKLAELNQIDLLKAGDEQSLMELSVNIAHSIYSGSTSGGAYITDRYVNGDDVAEVVDAINSVTDNELAYIAENNLTLNAANIKSAKLADTSMVTVEAVEFKVTIYEARLIMTQSSVYNLKRLGVDINYTDISQMTEDIINERNKLLDTILNSEEYDITEAGKELLSDTYNIMEAFKSLPNAVVGKIYTSEISFTMSAVYSNGSSLKIQYEQAMTSYETLGTEVRRDLGDSISKAFNNIDDILTDIGMEVNSVNQRAVRILGYNSMEITVENVVGIREIAAELDYLMDNMTPKTALHLIKNGINPLEDNIKDVNDMLTQINEEIGKDDESMGKFLWNLEKKGQVTPEEKSNYIELYRILNMISKNDGNVIGYVLSEGRELTLKNLYSAYKSKKMGELDYSATDEAISYTKRSLTSFMENSIAITELTENGQLKDMSLEKMIDLANEQDTDASYYEEQMKQYEDILKLSNTELENIVRNLDSTSLSNIAAYMEYSNVKEFRRKINEYKEVSDIVEEIEGEIDSDGDIVSLDVKYQQLEKVCDKLHEDTRNQTDLSYERLQGSLLMTKTLNLLSQNAKRNSYYVPMDIAGEVTNVHLTINHTKEASNSVTISMENEMLGRIESSFYVKASVVSGTVVANSESTLNMISSNINMFQMAVSSIGISAGEITYYKSNGLNQRTESTSDENVGTNTYYSIAKAFIGMIKVSSEVK